MVPIPDFPPTDVKQPNSNSPVRLVQHTDYLEQLEQLEQSNILRVPMVESMTNKLVKGREREEEAGVVGDLRSRSEQGREPGARVDWR